MIYYHIKEDRDPYNQLCVPLVKGQLITFNEIMTKPFEGWLFNSMLNNGTAELIQLSSHKTHKAVLCSGIRLMDSDVKPGDYQVIDHDAPLTQQHETRPIYIHAFEPTDLYDLQETYSQIIEQWLSDGWSKEQVFYFVGTLEIYPNPDSDLSDDDQIEIEQEIYNFNERRFIYDTIREVVA